MALGFQVLREPSIRNNKFSTRNHIRNPDLLIRFGKFTCYLELDGKVHGSLEAATQNTIWRNRDYERIKIPYVIVSEEDASFNVMKIQNMHRAFEDEDVPLLEAVQTEMETTDFFSLDPVLMSNDIAPVRVRKKLLELINQETQQNQA